MSEDERKSPRTIQPKHAPVSRLHGILLLDKLATLLKDEMAPVRLSTLARAKRSDQLPLRVGDKRVRQGFLWRVY